MAYHQGRADLHYRDDYLLPGEVVHLDAVQRMYVERAGEGPPLLLVPGMSGDAAELAPLRDALRARFDTLCIDRRGFSRSPRGWSKSSIDAQADDLARVMDVAGWRAAFVIASGIGAAAAIKLVARYPRRVLGAVLHEPWAPGLLPDPARLAEQLAQGEAEVQAARARRNTGPFEARLRWLMGDAFEAFPAEARARLVKNGEMHAVENAYCGDWQPPPPMLLPRECNACHVSVGERTRPAIAAMARGVAQRFSMEPVHVPGMHAPWLDDAAAWLAAVQSPLESWSRRLEEVAHA